MASDFLTATELIAILSVYCVILCPVLCWTIAGSIPAFSFKSVPAIPSGKTPSPSLQ